MNELIKTISAASDRYGDKLLVFMERYGLDRLSDATEEQAREFIAMEGLT